MLSEEFFSSVCGPPIAANTAISKDVGVYTHTLTPSYAVNATFKKSSCPKHGLAISDTHIFAAQDQKAHVHVYSRKRGNQEALVSFAERIRSLALAGNVLVAGTTEGRLILWETCTGRQVTTPPCHVQAVSCIAVTRHHILSASDDSNINVWSLARLVELDSQAELEPDLVLSNHRGAITDLAAGPGDNPETALCVSASKDKTCIVWNYRTGHVLRTLLLPTSPLCLSIDPCARAVYVASEGRAVFVVELFGSKPLLGSRAPEPASIVVQVNDPLAVADDDAGEICCLASSYDGTSILTGHASGKILRWSLTESAPPAQLTNLNASVTNIAFDPLLPGRPKVSPLTVVKPNQAQRQHVFSAQLKEDAPPRSRFSELLNSQGFSEGTIEEALLSFSAPEPAGHQASDMPDGAEPMLCTGIASNLLASMKSSTFQTSVGT